MQQSSSPIEGEPNSVLNKQLHLAFIGTAGIPNRHGGFESFLEHCAPLMVKSVGSVTVTCDASMHEDRRTEHDKVRRIFLPLRANGWASVLHDAVAFTLVFRGATHIFVMGVSGGLWFGLMRLLCDLFGKKLVINIDGVEWQRSKFHPLKRSLLRAFSASAEIFAHKLIVDNEGLLPLLSPRGCRKALLIPYPGDHAIQHSQPSAREDGLALTICRIEPENQLEMLIEAALASKCVKTYIIVGNWSHSEYAINLRARFEHLEKVRLLDPIYDPRKLAALRSRCSYYLHGHRVGGTNPSLVEILFFDCAIFAFDCVFNRFTAGNCVRFFKTSKDLADAIESQSPHHESRIERRSQLTGSKIAAKYVDACK